MGCHETHPTHDVFAHRRSLKSTAFNLNDTWVSRVHSHSAWASFTRFLSLVSKKKSVLNAPCLMFEEAHHRSLSISETTELSPLRQTTWVETASTKFSAPWIHAPLARVIHSRTHIRAGAQRPISNFTPIRLEPLKHQLQVWFPLSWSQLQFVHSPVCLRASPRLSRALLFLRAVHQLARSCASLPAIEEKRTRARKKRTAVCTVK